MKNTIYIEIDSEKSEPILFGKGPDSPAPKNEEEAKNMVIIDINCLTEALLSLIHLADQNGYGDKTILTNKAIDSFKNFIEIK